MESFVSAESFQVYLHAEKYKRLLQTEVVRPLWERLDSVLLILRQIEGFVGHIECQSLSADFEKISESLDRYKRTQNLCDLDDINEVVNGLVIICYKNLSASMERYAEKISSLFVQQNELDVAVKKCEKIVNDTTNEANLTKSKFQEQFDVFIRRSKELTDNYQKKIDFDRERFKKESDGHLTGMMNFVEQKKKEWDDQVSRLNQYNAEYIKGIQELNDKLKIATYGIQSSAYLDASQTERKFADILRAIALLLMVVVASLVAMMTFMSPDKQDVYGIAVRFILIFTLMIPAGYASKESGKHRVRSEYYRLRGMEILALENYVSDMPKEEALGIKKVLVDRYFGVSKPDINEQIASGTPELLDMLSKVTEVLKSK